MLPAMFTFRNAAFIPRKESVPEAQLSLNPSCLIRANSRLVVRLTRQSSSTAATDRPMMNPVQMPRAPIAGTIQSVRARM